MIPLSILALTSVIQLILNIQIMKRNKKAEQANKEFTDKMIEFNSKQIEMNAFAREQEEIRQERMHKALMKSIKDGTLTIVQNDKEG
jgi:ABC-type multidrug transport system fused ATPase/permease subunit